MEEPNILILTAHYGAGHIMVANALKEALTLQGAPNAVILDFFDLTSPRFNRVVQSIHRETTKRAPGLYGVFYRGMDAIKPDSRLQEQLRTFGHGPLSEYLNKHRPDAVVCTYPTPAGVLSRMKENGEYEGAVITVVTDYRAHSHWLHPAVDLYLVAHSGMKVDLAARGIDDDRIAVTGIPIHPKFFEPTSADRSAYDLGNEEKVATRIIEPNRGDVAAAWILALAGAE